MFLQLVVSGLAIGSIYALVALAMALIYKTIEVPNFAQGEMAMISTYVAFTLLTVHRVPFLEALLLALIFAALLGAFFEFSIIRRARHPNVLDLMIVTLGFQLILYGLAGWKWGGEQRSFPVPISATEVMPVGPVVISHLSLLTLAISLFLMVSLFLFFRFTRMGLAVQATQQNPLAARINGIPTGRVTAVVFAMSSVTGAVGALLFAPIVTLDPNLMWDPLMKGFAAAVLGGMRTLAGPVLGGYLLGVTENLFAGYVSVEFKSVVALALIVLVLCFRPSGLFAKHFERRV